MKISLTEIVTSLDKDEDVHLARILVLLLAFTKPDRPSIEGITKLAKLDFLLRYPSCLKKALIARGAKEQNIPVDDYEAMTIEARMVRYRYGPWDHRYRKFLNILASKGLITVALSGKKINIDLTNKGTKIAERLAKSKGFSRIFERAELLEKWLDIGARKLMEFVYEVFPELTSLDYNEHINFRETA